MWLILFAVSIAKVTEFKVMKKTAILNISIDISKANKIGITANLTYLSYIKYYFELFKLFEKTIK